MGKIRGKSIKIAAKKVLELYYMRISRDYYNNHAVVMDVVETNKKTGNQIAGYVTHLYQRIQKSGTVKGVHIKSHEEDKERKENLIPKVGILDTETVFVDRLTNSMLKKYGISGANYVVVDNESYKKVN
ncbi:RS17 [Hepatospora eriocheir]|uniref:RS17 n=1 Tax=Hepatospora eriocheir TaxID=1081669 RepID=A0A1X0QCK5_9MICR|nr:RS17 [Hepatospora eriocheir]ORE00436.1 RS17 [Hepatospora eriocheir]